MGNGTGNVIGVQRHGQNYKVLTNGPAMNPQQDHMRAVWPVDSDIDTVRRLLLHAQLNGIDSPIEREDSEHWKAYFLRPVELAGLRELHTSIKAQNDHALKMAEYDDYHQSMDDAAGRGGWG